MRRSRRWRCESGGRSSRWRCACRRANTRRHGCTDHVLRGIAPRRFGRHVRWAVRPNRRWRSDVHRANRRRHRPVPRHDTCPRSAGRDAPAGPIPSCAAPACTALEAPARSQRRCRWFSRRRGQSWRRTIRTPRRPWPLRQDLSAQWRFFPARGRDPPPPRRGCVAFPLQVWQLRQPSCALRRASAALLRSRERFPRVRAAVRLRCGRPRPCSVACSPGTTPRWWSRPRQPPKRRRPVWHDEAGAGAGHDLRGPRWSWPIGRPAWGSSHPAA